ncbi:hypothetical protein BG005_011886 [Podila minutissima]|nr:hypothetical protein BG005_011886 [Podila minutissima]
MEEINRRETWTMVENDRYPFLANVLEKRQHTTPVDSNNHTTAVSRQHNHDNRSSVEHQGLDENTGSKATITAGVTVFVLGMFILIATAGYFLIKGKWGRAKKSKTEEPVSGDGEQRPMEEPVFVVGQVEETELRTIIVVSADPKVLPAPEHSIATPTKTKRQQTIASTTIPSTILTTETPTLNNHDTNSQTSSQQVQVYLVEQSPSTARLVEPQSASVFAFLKGTNYHTGSHMPALTRTKARSSVKHKRKNRIFPPRTQTRSSKALLALPPQPTTTTSTSTRSSFESSSSSTLTRTNEPALVRTASCSSSSLTTCDSRSVHSIQRNIFSPIRPSRIRRSGASSSSTLRLDLKNTRSSSVLALFGSPRSSPSGSVADGASIQALYCPSLKSALSLVTNTEPQDHSEVEPLPAPTNIQA